MSACNRCRSPIIWQKNPGGWVPMNADGTRHRCAARGNKPALTKAGRRITGAHYTPPACGGCAVPPWEVCACSAQLVAA